MRAKRLLRFLLNLNIKHAFTKELLRWFVFEIIKEFSTFIIVSSVVSLLKANIRELIIDKRKAKDKRRTFCSSRWMPTNGRSFGMAAIFFTINPCYQVQLHSTLLQLRNAAALHQLRLRMPYVVNVARHHSHGLSQ